MTTLDIRITRILFMVHSFWFWPFMLLERSGYLPAQRRKQTRVFYDFLIK